MGAVPARTGTVAGWARPQSRPMLEPTQAVPVSALPGELMQAFLTRLGRARRNDAREDGQMLVLFALVVVILISVAGMLLDGGMASAVRRQAQNAADTAALAAAKAIGAGTSPTTAAEGISGVNGFPATTTSCSGASVAGVIVNQPPVSGAYAGNSKYVEVVAQRPMRTAFSAMVGQPCWMVSARAVAVAVSTALATCNFCSLNDTDQNHTLVLKNSATLRVDGEIYVNSTNGGVTPGVCALSKWKVCGDGFDVFGDGGSISAKRISAVGGWETHDENIATADELALKNGMPCPEHPSPPSQLQTANVCIHMPILPDPLDDPAKPGSTLAAPMLGARPVAGQNGCPAYALSASGTSGSPSLLTISSGTPTVCPGTYFGGIKIQNAAAVTMLPGTYVLAGGGFQVLGSASVDGSAGVLIYNGSAAGPSQSTNPGTDHVPVAVPTKLSAKKPELKSSNSPSDPGESTTFTFSIEKNGTVLPTGTMTFYDGDSVACAAVPVVPDGTTKVQATCTRAFALWGTHAISAVYSGDTLYNAIGDAIIQTIRSPGGTPTAPITLLTTGAVKLSAPTGGPYQGLLIFQDRDSNLTLTIEPGTASAIACPTGFMGADLSGYSDWKGGCGRIGGLKGTIYAPHDDALVLITAGGLARLQVIAGQIQIDSGADARFAYDASSFHNTGIALVE